MTSNDTTTPARRRRLAATAKLVFAPGAQAESQFDVFKQACVNDPQSLDGVPGVARGVYSTERFSGNPAHPDIVGPELVQTCKFYDSAGKYINSSSRDSWDPLTAAPHPGSGRIS
jgi:hypothetical protein